jgi:hypothetical protein
MLELGCLLNGPDYVAIDVFDAFDPVKTEHVRAALTRALNEQNHAHNVVALLLLGFCSISHGRDLVGLQS